MMISSVSTSAGPGVAGARERASVQAEPSATAPGASQEPNLTKLKQAVAAANTTVRALASSLEFSIDEATGNAIVRVVDADTHQLIRQIPSEEMLAIARALDRLQGLLLEQEA